MYTRDLLGPRFAIHEGALGDYPSPNGMVFALLRLWHAQEPSP